MVHVKMKALPYNLMEDEDVSIKLHCGDQEGSRTLSQLKKQY